MSYLAEHSLATLGRFGNVADVHTFMPKRPDVLHIHISARCIDLQLTAALNVLMIWGVAKLGFWLGMVHEMEAASACSPLPGSVFLCCLASRT